MTADLEAILQDLPGPGRTLAFCDETNLTEQATATLVANLRLHVAVVAQSEVYGHVAEALGTFLEVNGLPEFHATEVVNPKAGTPWRDVSFDLRVEAFERLAQALDMAGSRIPYLYLSKQDHDGFVARSGGLITADYKRSLKTVFWSCMADYLVGSTAILVIDRDKNSPGPVLHAIQFPGNLLGGGAISVESHKVVGLQIADMAAYAVRRYLLKRDALYAGNGGPFDEIAAKAVASFEGRFELLLNAEPLAA